MFVVNEGVLINYTKFIYYINNPNETQNVFDKDRRYKMWERRTEKAGGFNSQYIDKLPVIQTLQNILSAMNTLTFKRRGNGNDTMWVGILENLDR